ncbi:MAG: ATP phosphoribosyltransferase regulatory subunit [Terriglobia bacterium]|jgi:ATP phosphoribosyltransferase regulatory subunit
MDALTQIPLGTQVLLGEKARLKRRVEMMVTSVFEGWSYDEIIPPIFDYMDVFERGVGAELGKKVYRFLDREGNILALRPEFTSLVAKTVACRMIGSPKPIRLYYSGEVLRYEPPRGGQQREFSQIGLEHIGGARFEADVEVLAIAMEVLTHLGLKDFQINLGHREYFAGIADRIGCEPAILQRLRELIDIKDKTSLRAELRRLNLKGRRKDTLLALPDLTGGREVLRRARKLVTNDRSLGALDHLEGITRTFSSLGFDRHLTLDLSEVRGLEYYTGVVFRIFVPGLGFEIGGGGRYDKLFSNFGASWRAVGFSFSLERLMQCAHVRRAPGNSPRSFHLTSENLRRQFPKILKARRSGQRVKLG